MFLPFTIYLQSILGFSALKAGLVIAPMSLVSMFVAPVAGQLTDRIGGKFILISGLTLYAIGMGWVVAMAGVSTHWIAFLPGFLLTGLGVGGVFAPMATEAMRNVDPRLAGAASGVNNTIRQIGSVVGSASMGALLQNRLAVSLQHEATTRAGQIPPQARAPFIAGFKGAAKGGIEVGAGQSGAAQHLPAGTPKGVAAQISRIATEVFQHGYVSAMKPTMVLPMVVVLIAAASCFAMERHRRATAPRAQAPVETTA
jgi:MFS family permease